MSCLVCRRPVWWIVTAPFAHGGEKVHGPFESEELARNMQSVVEKVSGYDYHLDEEPMWVKVVTLAVVNEQAEDEGLWFIPDTVGEAYLQRELRRLHAVIEGELA